ncbi:MAG: hydroxyacid dehydrogenase [bacterium]|nr:hydroxyacid dehydrogenase [bacterium]
MKMLMFDFRNSEREYFNKHDLPDFDIEFIKEPLNEMYVLSEKQLEETVIISVFITSEITENIIKKFKNLRIISTRSTGYDHIDLKYCNQNHIAVFNVQDYGKNSVAQYTFMLILALVRKLIPAYLSTQKNLIEMEALEGRNLENLTLGILGGGSIGKSVANIANFFGIKILICSIDKDNEISTFAEYVSMDEILEKSDIITLHLPYNVKTHHIIDEKELSKTKKGVLLVNTARGELIDTVALYNNLITGQVGGVALDVYECENESETTVSDIEENCLPNILAIQKMLGMNNVIITPHTAYNTKESVDILLDTTFNSIRDYLKGLHTNQLRL